LPRSLACSTLSASSPRGFVLPSKSLMPAIQAIPETAELEFANGNAPGVRLRKQDQVKAARHLLRWNVQKLAAGSRTSQYLIRTYERSGRVAVAYLQKSLDDPLAAICAALEEAGIEFTDGEAPGVQLRGQAE